MSKAGYKQQRGMGISKLLMIFVLVGAVALLGLKLTPEYIEYFKIQNIVKVVAAEVNTKPDATVADVRVGFERRAEIDHIKGLTSADLDVTKDGNQIVVGFAYERKVHLLKNISVLIEFEGSSAK